MEGGEQAAATTGGSQSVESERRDEARLHIGSCRALCSCSPPSRELATAATSKARRGGGGGGDRLQRVTTSCRSTINDHDVRRQGNRENLMATYCGTYYKNLAIRKKPSL